MVIKKKFHYRAMGVLSGNKRDGYYCELCQKEIGTILHFKVNHSDIYDKVMEICLIRN
jgi:hypothetical protein